MHGGLVGWFGGLEVGAREELVPVVDGLIWLAVFGVFISGSALLDRQLKPNTVLVYDDGAQVCHYVPTLRPSFTIIARSGGVTTRGILGLVSMSAFLS